MYPAQAGSVAWLTRPVTAASAVGGRAVAARPAKIPAPRRAIDSAAWEMRRPNRREGAVISSTRRWRSCSVSRSACIASSPNLWTQRCVGDLPQVPEDRYSEPILRRFLDWPSSLSSSRCSRGIDGIVGQPESDSRAFSHIPDRSGGAGRPENGHRAADGRVRR